MHAGPLVGVGAADAAAIAADGLAMPTDWLVTSRLSASLRTKVGRSYASDAPFVLVDRVKTSASTATVVCIDGVSVDVPLNAVSDRGSNPLALHAYH